VKLLIKQNAKLNSRDNNGDTPLMRAEQKKDKHSYSRGENCERVIKLLEEKSSAIDQQTPTDSPSQVPSAELSYSAPGEDLLISLSQEKRLLVRACRDNEYGERRHLGRGYLQRVVQARGSRMEHYGRSQQESASLFGRT